MKSTAARRSARPTLGATRPWITAGCATAQWKARFARRYPPPLEPPLANRAFYSFCGAPNPRPLDRSLRSNHHRFDPRKQTPGGRHQIGTPAGFKSESVAGFLLECAAGFVGIRNLCELQIPPDRTPAISRVLSRRCCMDIDPAKEPLPKRLQEALCRRRTELGCPAFNIRLSTATPTAVSARWPDRLRARRRGPMMAL